MFSVNGKLTYRPFFQKLEGLPVVSCTTHGVSSYSSCHYRRSSSLLFSSCCRSRPSSSSPPGARRRPSRSSEASTSWTPAAVKTSTPSSRSWLMNPYTRSQRSHSQLSQQHLSPKWGGCSATSWNIANSCLYRLYSSSLWSLSRSTLHSISGKFFFITFFEFWIIDLLRTKSLKPS